LFFSTIGIYRAKILQFHLIFFYCFTQSITHYDYYLEIRAKKIRTRQPLVQNTTATDRKVEEAFERFFDHLVKKEQIAVVPAAVAAEKTVRNRYGEFKKTSV